MSPISFFLLCPAFFTLLKFGQCQWHAKFNPSAAYLSSLAPYMDPVYDQPMEQMKQAYDNYRSQVGNPPEHIYEFCNVLTLEQLQQWMSQIMDMTFRVSPAEVKQKGAAHVLTLIMNTCNFLLWQLNPWDQKYNPSAEYLSELAPLMDQVYGMTMAEMGPIYEIFKRNRGAPQGRIVDFCSQLKTTKPKLWLLKIVYMTMQKTPQEIQSKGLDHIGSLIGGTCDFFIKYKELQKKSKGNQ